MGWYYDGETYDTIAGRLSIGLKKLGWRHGNDTTEPQQTNTEPPQIHQPTEAEYNKSVREIQRLKDQEDLTFDQIGKIVGLKRTTASSRYYSALNKCRRSKK